MFKGIIDGILSGVWKYFCYKEENIFSNVFKFLYENSGEYNSYFTIDVFFEDMLNRPKIKYANVLDEIGLFLCDLSVFYLCLCKYLKKHVPSDYNVEPYSYIFKHNIIKDMQSKYSKMLSDENVEICEDIEKYINQVHAISNAFLDRYKIYEDTSSFVNTKYEECFILMNINPDNRIRYINNRIKSYKIDDLLIVPIETNQRKNILNEICKAVDSSEYKILFYRSSDPNIVLFATSINIYGTLFLKNIRENVKRVKEMPPKNISELIVFSDELIDVEEFNTSNYYFTKDKQQYTDLNTDSPRHFVFFENSKKGDEKVKIENINIYDSEIYNYVFENIESVSSELTYAERECKDEEIKKYISEALLACENKNKGKFVKCLKWLGDNAMDFIKQVGANVLAQVILNIKC